MNITILKMQKAQIVELPTGVIEVKVDAGEFFLDDLVGFAARSNCKRGFLFLSKVLGKHWPARPKMMGDIHHTLAKQVPANLPAPVVFIAMAETAIGLGQGVFEAYCDVNPNHTALFLHTSRYHVANSKIVEFEEAHSHAPRQFLHIPVDADLRELLLTARSLVLVDDEASTGNTFLNLSAACRTLAPTIERVHLATITNFMGQAKNDELSRRFAIQVTQGAALSGEYKFTPSQVQQTDGTGQNFEAHVDRGASSTFGRVGTGRALAVPVALADRLCGSILSRERVLVLGTGEFMHMPFLLGRELENRNIDVVVQSTTRSPILQWGAVGQALSFPDNYGEGIMNFLYNVEPGHYDHVFICHETPPNAALQQLANTLDARLFHFLSANNFEEIPVRRS